MNVRAKKGFGQHFLKDHNIAAKIVNSLNLEKSSNVMEIGPGMGVLTRFLLEKDIRLKVVELDAESVEYLQQHYMDLKGSILHADILKIDLESVFNDKLLLIGNLPYNISSQIFFRMLKFKDLIPESVFMVQREVAERIVSPPGSKIYGILSVILQTFYDVSLLFHVGPKVFHPPPKVNSTVIKFIRNSTGELPVDEKLFISVVKQAFNQRRKTLRNALKSMLPAGINMTDPVFSKRAEQLSKEDFLHLTETIEEKNRST